MKNRTVTALVIVSGLSAAALAQESKPVLVPTFPGQPAPAAATPAPKAPPPTWTDADIGRVGDMLAGTWKTSVPVGQGDDPSKSTDMYLAVAHVSFPGLADTLYVESGRVDAMHRPSRQGIWQLYRRAGKIRLRTFEFRSPGGENSGLVGVWAAADAFPVDISMRNLVGTLDLELAVAPNAVTGKTPYPYPTGLGGAVEMTSEISVSGDKLETADRGMSADGKQVWGPAGSGKYTFTKFQAPVKVDKRDNGLVILHYVIKEDGPAAQIKGRLGVQYIGALMNGMVFDTTREPGRAAFQFELGQPMIEGFTQAMEGLHKGDLVRVIIPSHLGYKDQGNKRAKIPGNATLAYEIEVLDVEAPPAEQPVSSAPPEIHGNPVKIEPVTKPPFVVNPPEAPAKDQPK